MKAAGEARKYWARRRCGGPPAHCPPAVLARVGAVASLILALCGAGLRRHWSYRNAAQRQPAWRPSSMRLCRRRLANSMAARATPINSMPAQLSLIERRAGLRDLRFDAELDRRPRPRSAVAARRARPHRRLVQLGAGSRLYRRDGLAVGAARPGRDHAGRGAPMCRCARRGGSAVSFARSLAKRSAS